MNTHTQTTPTPKRAGAPASQIDANAVYVMASRNLSNGDIAVQLGVSRRTLIRAVRRNSEVKSALSKGRTEFQRANPHALLSNVGGRPKHKSNPVAVPIAQRIAQNDAVDAIYSFLKVHPDSTFDEIQVALNLSEHRTAESLRRLMIDLGLVSIWCDNSKDELCGDTRYVRKDTLEQASTQALKKAA